MSHDPTPLAQCLARPVALGWLSRATAAGLLACDASHGDRPEVEIPDAIGALDAEVTHLQRRRRQVCAAIRAAIWPLCRARAPGADIIAAAQECNPRIGARPALADYEVVEFARQVARDASARRGSRGRG